MDARLTLELNMLLDDTRLDVVVAVTLNRDIIPRHLPSVHTFDKRLGLLCRGEVQPSLQTCDRDAGEGGGDGAGDQESQIRGCVTVVREVL